MMVRIVRTEIWKLKRYYVLWAGVLLMLLSVCLTLFTSTAQDGSVWDFPFLIEQVIKNNMSTIFPMCITLIAGYMIEREEKDDTLKNIRTIPVSYRDLIFGKLVACGLISCMLGVCCTFFTVIAGLAAGFPGFSGGIVLQASVQITLNCLFLYIAVLPVIAAAGYLPGGRLFGVIIAFVYGYGGMFAAGSDVLADIYPITASLGMIGYRSYDSAVHWNMPLCAVSMCAMLGVTACIVRMAKEREGRAAVKKKEKQAVVKKGW